MHVEREVVTVVTAADGTATAYTGTKVSGPLLAVHYIKPGAGGYDNGVDFTITAEDTGENIWTQSDVNASATKRPMVPTHDQVGAAALYAAGGAAVLTPLVLANERIKIVLAQGGNVKTGTFHFVIG